MSSISGTNVAAPIRPFDSADTFATSFANEAKGGLHSVATLDELYAIPPQRRELGMHVVVTGTGEEVRLISNPADALTTATNWAQSTNLSKIYVDDKKTKSLQDLADGIEAGNVKYAVFVVYDANVAGPNTVELTMPFDGAITKIVCSAPASATVSNVRLQLEKFNDTTSVWDKVEELTLTANSIHNSTSVTIPNYAIVNSDKLRVNIITPQSDIKVINLTVTVLES